MIAFLQTELTARTEELRRKDHLIAALTEIISTQPPSLPTSKPHNEPDEPMVQYHPISQDRSGQRESFWTRCKRFFTG
jgi:hypothetical protein